MACMDMSVTGETEPTDTNQILTSDKSVNIKSELLDASGTLEHANFRTGTHYRMSGPGMGSSRSENAGGLSMEPSSAEADMLSTVSDCRVVLRRLRQHSYRNMDVFATSTDVERKEQHDLLHGRDNGLDTLAGSNDSDAGILQSPAKLPSQLTESRTYACHLCEKTFVSGSGLRRHANVHSAERCHLCETCGKSFRQKGHLRVHMLIHAKDKPHACHLCDRKFTLKAHLKGHMMNHTGERPYGCDQCDRRFAVKGSLKVHLLIHSGTKPHECITCGRRFTQSSTLRSHILTHIG